MQRRAYVSLAIVVAAFSTGLYYYIAASSPMEFRIDTSVLPDISDALVTATNPARNGSAMDHQRCARLHNYIVAYGWLGQGHAMRDMQIRSFSEAFADEAGQLDGRRLHPSLLSFLESINVPPSWPPFFFWVAGILPPSMMFPPEDMFPDEEVDRFVTLYSTNLGLGSHPLGLVYDQKLHRASMLLDIQDTDYTMPAEEHESMWFPLETVLSNWIYLIHIGKITASPDPAPNEKFGPWTWQPYSDVSVARTVAAFNKLVDAIELRMPAESRSQQRVSVPLMSPTTLDAASIPSDCFIRKVLARVRTPRFRNIAPGLFVPSDGNDFVSVQRFTQMNTTHEYGTVIPPVLLFPADGGPAVDFHLPEPWRTRNPFCRNFVEGAERLGKGSILAGLYSESAERFSIDNAEDGFRLILPFVSRQYAIEDKGPRQSDGTFVAENSIAELFQHGFKPFGGESFRAQRLERLLDRWTELVEAGTWRVGSQGVEGTIDYFRDNQQGAWDDCWIAPDW